MNLSRRRFLKTTSAAAASTLAAPYFVPASAFGANDRVVTGHIGVKNQGTSNLKSFLGQKNVTVGAVCDVDQNVLAAAVKLVGARQAAPDTFDDYRRLLDRKDIDVVVVVTPDHWHAKMTIDACRAGKDVYCEKPLTLCIGEGRKMVQAARETKRIVQTGSQQRSDEKFRRACELVRNGAVGKVQQVLVGIPGPNHPGMPVADADPPAGLNYDLWLGPAPLRPYNEKRVHYNFRFFRDYSGGQLTNFGAHHIDIAQWGLGMDDSGPVEIEGTATFHPQKWHEVTETCRITHRYANGVEMTVGQGHKEIPGGTTFIGTGGRLHVDRGKLKGEPDSLLEKVLAEGDTRLTVSNSHHANFLECIRSRQLPICDVEIGHRSATVCHLSNLALDLGRKLKWDPQAEQFVGDDEANSKIMRPYRAPWSLG